MTRKRFYLVVDGQREWMPFLSLKQAVASIADRILSIHHQYEIVDDEGYVSFRFGLHLQDNS